MTLLVVTVSRTAEWTVARRNLKETAGKVPARRQKSHARLSHPGDHPEGVAVNEAGRVELLQTVDFNLNFLNLYYNFWRF